MATIIFCLLLCYALKLQHFRMVFWLSNRFSWKNSLVLKSIAFSRSMIHSIDFEMSFYTFTNEIIFSSEFNIVRFQSMAYFETPCKSHLLCLKSCCWRLQKIHHCLLTHIPIFSFNSCTSAFVAGFFTLLHQQQ